ncbi:hypothetical protein VF12_40275 [Nostoc linckia z15]|nr:hypothetical protein VF12_40275 [Nostoc linckia z15]
MEGKKYIIEPEDFENYLNRLQKIVSQVRILNISIVTILFSSIILVISLITTNFNSTSEIMLMFNLAILVPSIGFLFLIYHQVILKRGNTLYEELVDEVEWKYKMSIERFQRLPIQTRVILKDYIKNRDLPFVNGQMGTLLYLIFFFLILVSVAYLKTSLFGFGIRIK